MQVFTRQFYTEVKGYFLSILPFITRLFLCTLLLELPLLFYYIRKLSYDATCRMLSLSLKINTISILLLLLSFLILSVIAAFPVTIKSKNTKNKLIDRDHNSKCYKN